MDPHAPTAESAKAPAPATALSLMRPGICTWTRGIEFIIAATLSEQKSAQL